MHINIYVIFVWIVIAIFGAGFLSMAFDYWKRFRAPKPVRLSGTLKFEEIGLAIYNANLTRNNQNLARRIIKLSEEMGEVAEAYLNVTSDGNGKQKTWDDVREELSDMLIVGYDCVLTPMPDQENATPEQIQAEVARWIETKLAKWKRNKDTGKAATDAE